MMSPGVTRPLLAPIRSRLSALQGEQDADGEACDAPRARCDEIEVGWDVDPKIAPRVGTAPSTVRLTIHRFEAAGLTWPLPDDMTDAVLEARLFASRSWHPAGPAAPCRAGLGFGASRAQAQARDAVGPAGGVHRK
jgi:hypothetical protein